MIEHIFVGLVGAAAGVALTTAAAYGFFCWFLWRCFGR